MVRWRRRSAPPPPSDLDRRRDVLDLPGGDLLMDLLHLLDEGGRDLLRDLADPDAAVLDAERRVAAALERARLHLLDRRVDGHVDLLQRARQDVAAEVRLVGVDADPPDLLLLRRVQGPEAAAAGDLEHDVRAGRDLVERELLARRHVGEALRIAVQDLDRLVGLLRAGLVAGDVMVDRRDLLAADRADHVGALPRLLLEAGEVADEVTRLLL